MAKRRTKCRKVTFYKGTKRAKTVSFCRAKRKR